MSMVRRLLKRAAIDLPAVFKKELKCQIAKHKSAVVASSDKLAKEVASDLAIATAVAAVKIGATDYLSKPADATDVTNALLTQPDALPPPPENPMSADRVRWEHIQRVYELCDRNVSETARRLNMHRRTLQRILAKRSPK